ncbi:hypothetical protein [Acetobacter syzygii]|uniref:hypothetical protein n=1 Tax=Acetobacter syzygii TaxID=146476 RepID=UPI0039ED0D0C
MNAFDLKTYRSVRLSIMTLAALSCGAVFSTSAKPSISGSRITLKFPKNIGKYVTTPAEVDVYDLATGILTKNGKNIPSTCKLDDGVCQG